MRPFKTGPDFIDPGWHAAACGLPSLNLDPWMQAWKELPGNAARQFLLHPRLVLPRAEVPRGSVPEIAIIEGAMGLYDGLPGLAASAADVALELHVPLLLVIDVRGMAASAAAVARGLAGLRPGLAVAGALCVMAGSVRHEKLLRAAFAEFCPDIPLLGRDRQFPGRPGSRRPVRPSGCFPAAHVSLQGRIFFPRCGKNGLPPHTHRPRTG